MALDQGAEREIDELGDLFARQSREAKVLDIDSTIARASESHRSGLLRKLIQPEQELRPDAKARSENGMKPRFLIAKK